MPIYEYHCRSCRKTFELLRPMASSTEPATCPAGHPKATRVLSLVAARPRGTQTAGAAACGSCAGGNCAGCGLA